MFGLVSLDCGLLANLLVSHFLRKKRLHVFFPARLCFSYLFNALTILFYTYLLPNHVKYYVLQVLKTFVISKHRGRIFVMMMSIVHLSTIQWPKSLMNSLPLLVKTQLIKFTRWQMNVVMTPHNHHLC